MNPLHIIPGKSALPTSQAEYPQGQGAHDLPQRHHLPLSAVQGLHEGLPLQPQREPISPLILTPVSSD